MQALHEEIKVVSAFPCASRNTATTLYNNAAIGDAVGVDCQGFEEALVSVNLGVVGDTTLDIAVGFADVDDAEDASFALLSGATFASIVDADDNKNFVIRIRTKDVGRYMFVKTVLADAVAVNYGIQVNLGKARAVPVSQVQTVNFTHNEP